MHFLHIKRTVYRSGADGHDTAGPWMPGDRHGIHHVLRAIGRQRGGRTHGAGKYHRLGRLACRLQKISRLLQRVGAVRDDNALDIVIRKKMADAGRELRPHVKAHVLAVDLTHLFTDDQAASGQSRNGCKQLVNSHLCSRVANVVSGMGSLPGNGSAGSQNDQFATLHKMWLLFNKSCMKIQLLAIHTDLLNFPIALISGMSRFNPRSKLMRTFNDFSALPADRPKLTARQAQILELIQNAIALTGAPPTRAEIAAQLGFRSPNAAEEHLKALAKKGAIELISGTSRGIRLRTDALRALNESRMDPFVMPPERLAQLALPLVGRVAAGSPILAQEHIEQIYHFESSLFDQKPDYLLKVRGMSMRDAGIMDGDLLAVKQTREAQNGQIVVARLGDEVTVKRFHRNKHLIELLSENPDFKPIVVQPGEPFELEGLAVGLIRGRLSI